MCAEKNPFLIRHYNPQTDLGPLSAMLAEIEAFDLDGEDASDEGLRKALEWPNYRPDQDVWVAEHQGRLAGYGVALEQPSQRCTLYVVVHPSKRRMQLGGLLLERALMRAHEFGSQNIIMYANDHNQASKSFLEKHGFLSVGTSGAMKAPASVPLPAVEFPAGFKLKTFSEVNDRFILASALIDCYLGMWGHQHSEKPSADNPNVIRFLEQFGATNILLLFDDENVVSGICSVKSASEKDEHGGPVDILDAPGVVHKYRRDGIQRQLVIAGIQTLHKTAKHPIKLEFWGDDRETLSIYRELGFEMLQQYIAYHKDLP